MAKQNAPLTAESLLNTVRTLKASSFKEQQVILLEYRGHDYWTVARADGTGESFSARSYELGLA